MIKQSTRTWPAEGSSNRTREENQSVHFDLSRFKMPTSLRSAVHHHNPVPPIPPSHQLWHPDSVKIQHTNPAENTPLAADGVTWRAQGAAEGQGRTPTFPKEAANCGYELSRKEPHDINAAFAAHTWRAALNTQSTSSLTALEKLQTTFTGSHGLFSTKIVLVAGLWRAALAWLYLKSGFRWRHCATKLWKQLEKVRR